MQSPLHTQARAIPVGEPRMACVSLHYYYFVVAMDTQYKAIWTERAAADEQVTCVWHLVSTVGEEESYLISRIDI